MSIALPFRAPSGVAVVPLVYRLAARVEQVPLRDMLTDPGALTRALRGAQRLFKYDGVTNVYDPSLEAEACGAAIEWGADTDLPTVAGQPWHDDAAIGNLEAATVASAGRIPIVVEATKRLAQELGGSVPIVGVVTGPYTLARLLRGDKLALELAAGDDVALDALDQAGQVAVAIATKYFEAGAKALMVVESAHGLNHESVLSELPSMIRSLWNVCGYYQAPSLLLVTGPDAAVGGSLTTLGADVLIVEAGLADPPDSSAWGLAIPAADLAWDADVAGALKQTNAAGAVVLTTAGEISPDTPAERVHDLVKAAHEL